MNSQEKCELIYNRALVVIALCTLLPMNLLLIGLGIAKWWQYPELLLVSLAFLSLSSMIAGAMVSAFTSATMWQRFGMSFAALLLSGLLFGVVVHATGSQAFVAVALTCGVVAIPLLAIPAWLARVLFHVIVVLRR